MADNVNVLNNDWARERTLAELLRETRANNQILEIYASKVLGKEQVAEVKNQTKEINNVSSEIRDSSEQTVKATEDNTRKTTSSIDFMRKELLSSFENIGNQLGTADPRGMFNTFSTNLKYTTRHLEDANEVFPRFIVGLSKVAGIMAFSYERLTDLNDAYVASYSAGVRFADGMDGLNKAVGDSGMSIQEFTGIMNRHSQTFNVLGGKDAVRLSKEFRKITRGGADLLMSQSESQESLMAYAEILRLSGRLSKTSYNDVAVGAKGFLENINDLSAVSGRSREEILRSTRDALAQPSFQAFMSGLDDIAKANLEKGVASLATFGTEIQNEYKDMIVAAGTGGTAAMYKTNQNLMMLATQTGQLPKLMNIIQLARAGQDTTSAMKEFYEGMKASNLVQSGQLNILAQFNPMYAGMRDEFGKLGIATNSLADLQKQAAERSFESVDAMLKYDRTRSEGMLAADNALKEAMSGMNAAFNDLVMDVMYPLVVPALHTFAVVINGLTVPLQLLSSGIKSLSELLTGMLGDTAGGFATSGAVLGTGYAGYRMLKAGGRALLGRRRGRQAGGELDFPEGPSLSDFDIPGMDSMSRSGKRLGPLVENMKGLGSGFGKMIQSVLSGIANGLKAFASPAVIGGAASLAGSIALIGGAVDLVIGGFGVAMMAIGKGLDYIGDGLVKFNDIDGSNLGEVGKGMALLGAGMAAMGVGEVVSAWGSIVDGVMSWFKADVKTKLLAYAEIGDPMKNAGEGLNSFATSFQNAINMLNNSTLADSVSTTFEQIKGFLGTDMGGWFGGAPEVIGQVNSLAESIGNLAQKTLEFQNAQTGAATAINPSMPAITTAELQKRTLMHYDDQKRSSASMVALLQSANDKLDTINGSIGMQTTDLSRAMRDAGRVF